MNLKINLKKIYSCQIKVVTERKSRIPPLDCSGVS